MGEEGGKAATDAASGPAGALERIVSATVLDALANSTARQSL